MNIEILEQIRTIAEYDGWVRREYQPVHGRELYENDRSAQWLDSMNYHKSYDLLMPVAVKVHLELDTMLHMQPHSVDNIDAIRVYNPLEEAATYRYIYELFAATYNAITYLNSLK